MITSPAFRDKRYAVLGLARSGQATVAALLASGARVTAWDSNEEARAALLKAPHLQGRGWGGDGDFTPRSTTVPTPDPSPEGEGRLVLADPLAIDLAGFDAVVVSPGVPLNTHPIAAKARAVGVPVIGDIELFAQARASLPPHKVVGITGTNGKSTTTALVHHILQTAGVPSLMGGNIGLPILSRDPLPEGGVYVLELSSYQIDLTFTLDCDVAVLLNITPDHLDRYDGFEEYAASKARLFEMSSGIAVIATEDDETRRIASSLRHAGLDPASRFANPKGSGTPDQVRGDVVEVQNSETGQALFRSSVDDLGENLAEFTCQSNWPALQGPHNAQNAAVAASACWALGDISLKSIAAGLRTYPGLPHRMERIAERSGVLYVNDSKATNATSTAPALAAYPAIHWILGGLPKSGDLDACAPQFDHVRAGYTIGQAGPLFARILREAGKPVTESGTLDRAVTDAASAAKPGEVVLLSPACASFDQFRDYEARGDAFRAAVEALA